MTDYRINVRFRSDVPVEREAAEYLQSLKKSRNKFIVSAVIAYMEKDTADDKVLLKQIREIFREEVQAVAISTPQPATASLSLELTEEQQAENARSVLADLEMFG